MLGPHGVLVAVDKVGSFEVVQNLLLNCHFVITLLFQRLFSRYLQVDLGAQGSKVLVETPDTPKWSHRVKDIEWLAIKLVAPTKHLRHHTSFGFPRFLFNHRGDGGLAVDWRSKTGALCEIANP